jgi:hypothetical protein
MAASHEDNGWKAAVGTVEISADSVESDGSNDENKSKNKKGKGEPVNGFLFHFFSISRQKRLLPCAVPIVTDA